MGGVLFDFNGTLLFDGKLQEESWHEFLEKKTGRKISVEEYQENMNGATEAEFLSYFMQEQLNQEQTEALEEEKEIIYRAKCLALGKDFQLAPGLPKFLDELKKNKIPFNLASASVMSNIKFFFERLNLDRWFNIDYVVHKDGKILSKPEPDMYLKAAEVIGMEISDCIIFEDSRSGIKAAKNSGAYKVVGITSTFDEKTLLERGVAKAISDYTDLNSLLELVCED